MTEIVQSDIGHTDSALQRSSERHPTEAHETYTGPSSRKQPSQTIALHWLLMQANSNILVQQIDVQQENDTASPTTRPQARVTKTNISVYAERQDP